MPLTVSYQFRGERDRALHAIQAVYLEVIAEMLDHPSADAAAKHIRAIYLDRRLAPFQEASRHSSWGAAKFRQEVPQFFQSPANAGNHALTELCR